MTNTIMSSTGVHKEYHNSDWGAPELDDGHAGHIGLISAYQVCTTDAEEIMEITSGKKGYVTFFSAYNSDSVAQTLTIAVAGSTILLMNIGTLETVTWIAGKEPFLELAEGSVTGDAGTGADISVTMSYYEK